MQTPATRIERLRASLARRLGDPAVEVESYREGVDSWVDLVRRPHAALAVARSAKVERRMTRYEGLVDYALVIEKEIAVARLLLNAGVPTPRVLGSHRTNDPEIEPSWMLVEFVPHDPVNELSAECQTELGRLARRIHSIEPAGVDIAGLAPSGPWHDWIRRRILARIVAAQRYMPTPSPTDVDHMLDRALATRPRQAKALLHLDLRAPNLAIQANRIASVFDLANSIVGDRYLELGRIRGCGLLTPSFLQGYGEDPIELQRNRSALDAYELDLAALLVVVSREEITDEDLHRQMIQRTATLLKRLASGSGPVG